MNLKCTAGAFTAFCLSLTTLCGFEIDSSWKIFRSKNADPTVRKSAADLAKYIQKISGKKIPVVTADPGKNAKVIRVQSNTKLGEEEWLVKYDKSTGLLLSGGLPNGVLYATGEFLEKALGCRFLEFDVEYVPRKQRIVLPDTLKIAGKPFFKGRSIYRGRATGSTEHWVRRKLNGGIYAGPEYGWYDRSVDNLNAHTYYLYSKKFPKDKIQEFGSLHVNGKRLHAIRGNGPGQLCMSNLELRDFVFKETVNRIETERARLKKQKRPFSKVIDISANDTNHKCVCKPCMALAEKHGGYSGAMLEFTNDIAARLEKRYPEMLVQTFAYEYTEAAPTKNLIKPRKNVMIHLAQLGGEYYSVTKTMRDSLRRLDHPNNRLALKEFKEWARYGTPLKMWDYWVLYDQKCSFPYVMVPALAHNIRTYARNNVCRIFGESEIIMGKNLLVMRNFLELTHYLAAKLMVDPFQDEQAIIRDFMKHYYGPAGKTMEKLLRHIEDGMKQEKGNIGKTGVGSSYLTKIFFDKAEQLFAEAEKAAGNNKDLLARIGQERIPFDCAMLELQNKLDLKFDREKVIERYKRNFTWAYNRHVAPQAKKLYAKIFKQRMEMMGKQLPVPKEFANKRVYDFPVFTMLLNEGSRAVDDPEAAGGKAYKLGANPKNASYHKKPFSFGVYSPGTKTFNGGRNLKAKETFKDEKYHFYYLGKPLALENDSFIWVHWSWRMSLKCLKSVYNPVIPDAKYGIWISVKLTGPDYVPGSKKENAVYVDRVIVTKE